MASAPPLDPAIVSSERPSAVYSRAQLLALYTSPLVPNKLEGMKELSEWHGEVLPPPSPPQSRSSLRPGQGERSTSDRNSRRLQHAADSSPFANFGRFGVDGGLGGAGDLLESPGAGRNTRRVKGGLGGADIDKDAAPHLLGREARNGLSALQSGGDRDRLGDRLSRTRGAGLDREDGLQRRGGGTELEPNSRRRTAANGSTGGLGADALESTSRRDARRGLGPADEGGWRNVGATREDRERRLARNGGPAGTDSPSSASRREGAGFGARTNGRPAWMDEDSASSPAGGRGTSGSSPAWMDAPATGRMSFDADGNARESSSPDEDRRRKDKRAAGGSGGASSSARELETYNPGAAASSGGAGANGGMDAMQAFKAQMKERERRERDRDLRARGLPIETDEPAAAAAAPTPSKSIFEDLGISRAPPGLGSPSPAAREVGGGGDEGGGDQGARGGGGGGGGRSSRFAKFFDGKPVPPHANETAAGAAPSSTASVFGSLMGGSSPAPVAVSTGPPPSKEDSDSMARLLGMLQVSGQRATSPNVMNEAPAMSPPPPPQQRSAADLARALSPQVQASSQPQQQRTEDGSNGGASGRSRSRFAFSHNQKDAPAPAAPQHPGLPNLQSPFAAASPLPPPSATSHQPPPGLASPMRSRAPTEASTADSLPSPRAARSEQGPTMSPPASGMPPSHGNFSPPPGLQQQQPGPQGKPPTQQPQMPYFGQGPPPPPPFAHGPPVGPDGRFLAHQMPLPGPNQLPPNMPPPFAFGPDGRPIPLPPNLGFASPPPPPFGGANGMPPRNFGGPLSPPLVSPPAGSSPAQMRGQPAQFPFPPGPPPPPHVFQQPPPHFAPGRMPLPPPNAGQGPPPPPPPMMTLGGNAGADLMALLNSGSGGQRIGANGPPHGVQVRQS